MSGTGAAALGSSSNKRSGSSAGYGPSSTLNSGTHQQQSQKEQARAQSLSNELYRKEKDALLYSMTEDIKKYDIDTLRADSLYQVHTIANNLSKTERQLIGEEKKNLRYLERVGAMQRALLDDHDTV